MRVQTWLSVVRNAGYAVAGLLVASPAWAQTTPALGGWQPGTLLGAVVSTVVFALIGIVMAILGFKLFDLFIPFNLEQEICENQNMAVAILAAAIVFGICLIVAVAVH